MYGEKIKHICADMVACDMPALGLNGSFDFLVSWLVIHRAEEDSV